ncbi:putative O-linked N-acetylglucosamine transferase (SPINDLY family) [Azospirillum fermentarium]|uniref:O-linked N-acetylglucosamine transferase, SPINDLY family protein n=1 Tax=Azospirillum fermentarium TaxID=1233114 RepID=UPI003873BEF4|nr:putative O-linked N-acetylglucosamine transferase (SPINDLY family) [Azospirillum fermentarium]
MLFPGLADAILARAFALLRLGRVEAAEAALLRVLSQAPLYPLALLRLAEIRLERGRLDEAFVALSQLLAHLPPALAAETHTLLGQALTAAGLTTGARQALETALALDPARFEAGRRLMALHFEAGRFDEGIRAYQTVLSSDPEPLRAGSILLYSLNFDPRVDDATLVRLHREWAGGLPAARLPAAPQRESGEPLRVGFMGARIGRHPVGYFLEPFLAHRRQTTAILYDDARIPDDLTVRLRGMADGWRATAGFSDEAVWEMARADRLDILVDVSGHSGGNRLPVLARRAAPVQVSWLDYFATTAVPAVDYALFDAVSVPPGAEVFFTEKIVRLPDCRFCYVPPDYAPAVASLPAEANGFVTFGSFNKLEKLTPTVVALWSRVLCSIPDARLVLKWRTLADLSEQAEVRRRFAVHGIGSDRVLLRGHSPHPAMLADYGQIDIALDPFPYNGGLTSCEALWMGVPVVTLAGRRPVSRQTMGFLVTLGLSDLSTGDEDRFVTAALALAGDRYRLSNLRRTLRARMLASPLCDGERFAGRLEWAFTYMAARFREGREPQAFAVPGA